MNLFDLVHLATSFKFENGHLVTICPTGYALGCWEIRSRGHGLDYANVNVWPDTHYRVTSGVVKYRDLNCGHLCFQQELYVYRRELGEQLQEAMELLKVRFSDEKRADLTSTKEGKHEKVCQHCQLSFRGFARSVFCSQACKLKHQTWAKVRAEVAKLEQKPEIYNRGTKWLVRGVKVPGARVGFDTFAEAAAAIVIP